MGLMLARVGHALGGNGIRTGGAIVGTAAVGTALLVGAEYGLNQDFDKPAPPSGAVMGWTLAIGGIAGAITGGMGLWGESAGAKSFGRGAFPVIAGVVGAILIGAPVIRRMAADS